MVDKIKKSVIHIVNNSLLCSIFINVFLFLFYLLFYKVHYETTDDSMLSQIISGFFGENDAHMIFVNYVLASFLKVLYLMCQSVPWHGIFQLFVCFCSMIAINYFLFETIVSKSNAFLVIIFDFFVAYELYVKVQFTKTSGIASTAGVLLVLLFTLFKERSIKGIFLGVILATVGFCYRPNMFFVSLLLCSTFGVLFLLKNKKFDKKQFFKRLLSCICSMTILFASIGIAFIIDKSHYNSPEWDLYKDKYKVLQQICDFKNFNVNIEKAKENGIDFDESDLNMLKSWNLCDDEVFSLDNLDIIAASINDPELSFKDFVKQAIDHLILDYYIPFYVFFIFSLLFLIRNIRNFRIGYVLSYFYLIFVILFEYVYMYLLGRAFLNRINCIMWFTATIFVIMITEESISFKEPINKNAKKTKKNNIRKKSNKNINITINKNFVFVLLFFILSQILYYPDYGKNFGQIFHSNKDVHENIFDVINEDKEHFYIATHVGTYFWEEQDIFVDIPLASGDNCSFVGSWPGYSPLLIEQRKKYNINNPFSDVINNNSVYWIDENMENTIKYIKHHYDENAEAILVKEVDKCKIYKIVSK